MTTSIISVSITWPVRLNLEMLSKNILPGGFQMSKNYIFVDSLSIIDAIFSILFGIVFGKVK